MRTFRNLAGEREGRGVEKSPRRLVAPIALRLVPLREHVGNTLDIEHAASIHLEHGMVGESVINWRLDVLLEGGLLLLALGTQRFDHLSDKTRQIALAVCRVLSAYDVIADEKRENRKQYLWETICHGSSANPRYRYSYRRRS